MTHYESWCKGRDNNPLYATAEEMKKMMEDTKSLPIPKMVEDLLPDNTICTMEWVKWMKELSLDNRKMLVDINSCIKSTQKGAMDLFAMYSDDGTQAQTEKAYLKDAQHTHFKAMTSMMTSFDAHVVDWLTHKKPDECDCSTLKKLYLSQKEKDNKLNIHHQKTSQLAIDTHTPLPLAFLVYRAYVRLSVGGVLFFRQGAETTKEKPSLTKEKLYMNKLWAHDTRLGLHARLGREYLVRSKNKTRLLNDKKRKSHR